MNTFFNIGMYSAATYAVAMILVSIFAIGVMFNRYVNTGRISSSTEDDEFSFIDRKGNILFFRRYLGATAFILGFLIDLAITMSIVVLWPVLVPGGILCVLAAILRSRKQAKENFINGLRGKHNHDADEDEDVA